MSGIRPNRAHASFGPPPTSRRVYQVNPHEDHGDGVQETDQELQNLLHHLNVPGALRVACPGPCPPAPGQRPSWLGVRPSPNRS
jgi:hypothetical protein